MILQGKSAVITGAASGIGASMATRFAMAGAAVVVADVNLDGAEKVAKAIRQDGGRCEAVKVDVASERDIVSALRCAITTFGRLDILCNNAALTGEPLKADVGIEHFDAATWDLMMAVNLRSAAFGCKHAIPLMRRHGGGSIINVASAAAGGGDYERTAYGASKAAMLNLTRYVATQHGKEGIRCNSIVPGLVLTPSADRYLTKEQKAVLQDAMLTPWFGTPDDVADLSLFLAGDASRYITGQSIWIDGGASARSQNAVADALSGMKP